ncbi:hypothetical protein FMM05_14890 [Flavobacterium zepuense]|uniref:Sulfatase N-terminal domain-containing protein n=1 Tax=Flavobacterium zepuense TaxID=2593302 RepID=A0A552UXQ4_9FLAO|nr:hypothetical protein [Flavobacterium zepuense]TRW22982.1 hypothetical protein FMM05_14890 [Flavobacterium zepuense]
MIERLRQRIMHFINSPKDVPLLAGFSIGVYMVLFYYAQNYSLANSWPQLLFLIGYYALIPALTLFVAYKLAALVKLKPLQRNILMGGMVMFLGFYIVQIISVPLSKKIVLAGVVLLSIGAAFSVKKYYKLLVLLLLFLSVFNLYTLAGIVVMTQTAPTAWHKLPDEIEKAAFKQRPNIYYIQPDGYTNPDNLKSEQYTFNNTAFETYLKKTDFKVYNSFRSNYYSTLLSNSSLFAMQHHYSQPDMDPYNARSVIISKNPVLTTLKSNGYKTHFITERPYLIINRPAMGYDYCNFDYSKLPYFMDGWDAERNVLEDLKAKVAQNGKSGNFYFVEKMTPGHISNNPSSRSIKGERDSYIRRIGEANEWLTATINFITLQDPNAIVIIGADHGGFAGFKYLGQTENVLKDTRLIKSMYGAMLAIKWNNPAYKEYDADLKSSVNLFRTVFSFLSQDKAYLNNYQKDESYMRTLRPAGVYKYINDKGEPVIEAVK